MQPLWPACPAAPDRQDECGFHESRTYAKRMKYTKTEAGSKPSSNAPQHHAPATLLFISSTAKDRRD